MTIYAGAKFPETLAIAIDTADGFDLSAVTSSSVTVVDPDGNTLAWSWAVSGASTAAVTLTHVFAAGGLDAVLAGDYTIAGWVITPSTQRRFLPVHIPFERFV